MPRYFMGGTPLSGLERMMMDPSRSVHDDDAQDERAEKKVPHGQSNSLAPPEPEGEEDGV